MSDEAIRDRGKKARFQAAQKVLLEALNHLRSSGALSERGRRCGSSFVSRSAVGV